MKSHELAQLLLSKRNTDVQIEVLIDETVLGQPVKCVPSVIALRDHSDAEKYQIASEKVVEYYSSIDYVVIKAAIVVPD